MALVAFSAPAGSMNCLNSGMFCVESLPLFSPEQSRRHCVRPGITGWAQVHGRNRVGWTERLELDVWYVDHRSFVLDLRILGMTLLQLLRPGDSAQQGHATMEPFRGTASAAPRRQGEVDG